MLKIDCKKLLDELVLISVIGDEMAARAREICTDLVTKKVILRNQNRELSYLMVAKKIIHSFMINRNFDLFEGENFDLFDDNIRQTKYKFLCRPEYIFRLTFHYAVGDNFVTALLERVLLGDAKSAACTLSNLPEFTDATISNDEYRIEQLLLQLTRKFSVLWSRFGSSSVSSESLLLENLDPDF